LDAHTRLIKEARVAKIRQNHQALTGEDVRKIASHVMLSEGEASHEKAPHFVV